ncbi:hypothetical protein IWX75_002711 [Arthrobacter sp. CAN_A6]|uniref:thioredoxin family protein n=1 Tax=Arthrobacter sp. CAN_A6 TaxID=2787721 RepID=UPI0018C927BE
MNIELLHIPECPNSEEAALRLTSALNALGRTDLKVHQVELASNSDIAGTAFAGSPTIALDGVDIFPTGGTTSDLACRIYRTSDGIARLPTAGQIHAALEQILNQ